MTFKQFLLQQVINDTPQGDFMADASEDEELPEVRCWSELQDYVRETADGSICQRIEDAAQAVWRIYEDMVLGNSVAL